MEQIDGQLENLPNEDVADITPTQPGNEGGSNPDCIDYPISPDDLSYKMDHKKRGIAIIFNHEYFENNESKQRTGTQVDCENLQHSLGELGFEVTVFENSTKYQIKQLIKKASETDHSDYDCFLIFVLTHGKEGSLYAYDSTYNPDMLWSQFTPDKCPFLVGKPKLFFIQACQGQELDDGIKVRTQVDSLSSPPFKIPTHSDFLIAYSTIPGYFSWRNTSYGSWFVQALCQELNENGFNYDLLTLLAFVNRRVAFQFETKNDVRELTGKKITPYVIYTLMRSLKFTKKPVNENNVN